MRRLGERDHAQETQTDHCGGGSAFGHNLIPPLSVFKRQLD
jgi:hypothetical protein